MTAIEDAIDLLGIKEPVVVKWSGGVHRFGAHRYLGGNSGENTHSITISTYLYPAQASKTLWHELTHAAQAERTDSPGAFRNDTRHARMKYGYHNSPYEKEAREVAETYTVDFPLTKEVKP